MTIHGKAAMCKCAQTTEKTYDCTFSARCKRELQSCERGGMRWRFAMCVRVDRQTSKNAFV